MGLEAQTLELLARHLIQWVRWPAIDFLVVDLPAGTSAVQHVLARLLKVHGALRCPHCGRETGLFEPAERSQTIWDRGVERLARLPMAPEAERRETLAALAGLVVTKLG